VTLRAGTIVTIVLLAELAEDTLTISRLFNTLTPLYMLALQIVEKPVGNRVDSVAGPRKVKEGKAELPPGLKGSQGEFNLIAPLVIEAVAMGIL
jgi:hypothetical protein